MILRVQVTFVLLPLAPTLLHQKFQYLFHYFKRFAAEDFLLSIFGPYRDITALFRTYENTGFKLCRNSSWTATMVRNCIIQIMTLKVVSVVIVEGFGWLASYAICYLCISLSILPTPKEASFVLQAQAGASI